MLLTGNKFQHMKQKLSDSDQMTGAKQATFGPGAQVASIECTMLDKNEMPRVVVADHTIRRFADDPQVARIIRDARRFDRHARPAPLYSPGC